MLGVVVRVVVRVVGFGDGLLVGGFTGPDGLLGTAVLVAPVGRGVGRVVGRVLKRLVATGVGWSISDPLVSAITCR